MKLYKSNCYQERKNIYFEEEVGVKSIEDFRGVVSSRDHMFSEMLCGRRKISNFLGSDVIGFDIDNSEQPYYSIKDFSKDFSDFNWFVATSKSHKVLKHDNQEDRFHIYFPLSETITDSMKLKYYMRWLEKQFPEGNVDKACVEVSRLFFANKDTECFMNVGEYIDTKIPNEEKVVKRRYKKRVMDSYEHARILVMLEYEKRESNKFDDYDTWLRLGLALKSAGFTVEDWLFLSKPEETLKSLEDRWSGFNKVAGGVTIGTLYFFIGEAPGAK